MAWGGPFLGQGHSVHICTHSGIRQLMNSPPVIFHCCILYKGLCSPLPVEGSGVILRQRRVILGVLPAGPLLVKNQLLGFVSARRVSA